MESLQTKDSKIHNGVNNKELRRLQFYGAGPKMAGFNPKDDGKNRGKKINYEDPVSIKK